MSYVYHLENNFKHPFPDLYVLTYFATKTYAKTIFGIKVCCVYDCFSLREAPQNLVILIFYWLNLS